MNTIRLRTWNDQLKLREWQERAVRRFYALGKTNFLAVGTPGSGKTMFALRLAHNLLSDRVVERVVVVAPTEHLKIQWATAAAAVGIDLDPAWANADGVEARDYHGAIVTYQQVSFAPDLYRFNCRRPTLVIFDEIHHAGDGLDWGRKIHTAFDCAAVRLALSGTPFRSDDFPIPFVTYRNGECRPDFVYSYGEALADNVCRPIYFYTRKGRVAWVRGNGREITAEMLDHLPQQEAAERLRAALDPSGNWLRDVLAEADGELTQKRAEGHGDAAGLVIAIDQPHARRIAALLKKITGETPAIAISDETEANRTIKQFATAGNSQRWIVAVKMISEGVDIPRLRVGVYATTTQSALFFRQAVGRLLRIIPNLGEQSAALYIPAVARLMQHALAIKEEREHYLQTAAHLRRAGNGTGGSNGTSAANRFETKEDAKQKADGENTLNPLSEDEQILTPVSVASGDERSGGNDARTEGENTDQPFNNSGRGNGSGGSYAVIVPLYSEALPHITIFNGMEFTPEELAVAVRVGRELGIRLPAAQLAALLKHQFENSAAAGQTPAPSNNDAAFASPTNGEATIETAPEKVRAFENQLAADNSLVTKTERKRAVREQINRQVNSLARRLGIEEREVHRIWLVEMNGSRQSEATEDELWRKLRWLAARNETVKQNADDADKLNSPRERAGKKV